MSITAPGGGARDTQDGSCGGVHRRDACTRAHHPRLQEELTPEDETIHPGAAGLDLIEGLSEGRSRPGRERHANGRPIDHQIQRQAWHSHLWACLSDRRNGRLEGDTGRAR